MRLDPVLWKAFRDVVARGMTRSPADRTVDQVAHTVAAELVYTAGLTYLRAFRRFMNELGDTPEEVEMWSRMNDIFMEEKWRTEDQQSPEDTRVQLLTEILELVTHRKSKQEPQ